MTEKAIDPLKIAKQGWHTLGTMMFTEQLYINNANVNQEIIDRHNKQIEQYKQVLIKQTKLAYEASKQE